MPAGSLSHTRLKGNTQARVTGTPWEGLELSLWAPRPLTWARGQSEHPGALFAEASGKAGPVFLLASPALSGTGPRGWKWLKGNQRRETAPRVLEGRFLDRRACPQSRKGRRQKTSVSLSFPAFHPAGTQPLAPAA